MLYFHIFSKDKSYQFYFLLYHWQNGVRKNIISQGFLCPSWILRSNIAHITFKDSMIEFSSSKNIEKIILYSYVPLYQTAQFVYF